MTDARAAYMKEYSSRPEVKARRSAYLRANTLKSNATPDELQKLASFYKSLPSEPEE